MDTVTDMVMCMVRGKGADFKIMRSSIYVLELRNPKTLNRGEHELGDAKR
jgi:hypothetical protein